MKGEPIVRWRVILMFRYEKLRENHTNEVSLGKHKMIWEEGFALKWREHRDGRGISSTNQWADWSWTFRVRMQIWQEPGRKRELSHSRLCRYQKSTESTCGQNVCDSSKCFRHSEENLQFSCKYSRLWFVAQLTSKVLSRSTNTLWRNTNMETEHPFQWVSFNERNPNVVKKIPIPPAGEINVQKSASHTLRCHRHTESKNCKYDLTPISLGECKGKDKASAYDYSYDNPVPPPGSFDLRVPWSAYDRS